MFHATCKSILLYDSECLALSSKHKNELNKIQAKLIKCIVGLGPKYRTSPLFKALNLHKISMYIDLNTLSLYHNIMRTHSAARNFNLLMLETKCNCPNLLVNRVKRLCKTYNFDFINIMTSASYVRHCKENITNVKAESDGLVDSVRLLLQNRNMVNTSMLRLLLKAF